MVVDLVVVDAVTFKYFLFELNLELHSGLKIGGSKIKFFIYFMFKNKMYRVQMKNYVYVNWVNLLNFHLEATFFWYMLLLNISKSC